MEVAYLPKKYILLTFINYQNLTQAKLKSCLHRPLFKTTRQFIILLFSNPQVITSGYQQYLGHVARWKRHTFEL